MKWALLSSNLLECARDDEVSMVHGSQISCELARKVVLILKFLPVDIRIWVFCLL